MTTIYEHAGKKYRLADQRDIGKEVYSSDVSLKSAVGWGRKILQSISDTGRGKYNCYSSKDRYTGVWTYAYVELTKEELQDSYTERQAAWVSENNVKPGTKVRVTRTAKGYEEGWNDYWMGDMDKYVGKVLEVNRTDGGSIHLLTGDGMYAWNFPYFVLEVVKEPLPATKVEVPPPPAGYEVVPESEYASYVPQSGDYFLGGMSNAWIPITCCDSDTCADFRNQWPPSHQLYAGFARRIPVVAERPKVDRPEAPEGWHYIGDDEVFVKGDKYMCDNGDYTQNVLSALGSTIQQRKSQPGKWCSQWVGVVRKNEEKPDLWRLLGDDEIVQEGDWVTSARNPWSVSDLKQDSLPKLGVGWVSSHGAIGKKVSEWAGGLVVARRIGVESKHQPKSTYEQMVKGLVKPGKLIASEMTAKDAHLMHMAIGVSGEAGELLDAVKKAVIYRKPLDRVNVVEELGDLEFYMEGLRQGLGITREECLKVNMEKLSVRYGQKYSDQAATVRADKEQS